MSQGKCHRNGAQCRGVPAPRGGLWNASTHNGSRKRQNGILSKRLYAGCLTYNRQYFVKDPVTGSRQARENPRSEWMTNELPELRIANVEIWETAQVRPRRSGVCSPGASTAAKASTFGVAPVWGLRWIRPL
jgi:hypothetical protein